MKKMARALRDIKGQASLAIETIAKEKTDVNTLKILLALAIFVLPGGMLLGAAGPVYQGVADVLLPATDMLPGPVIPASRGGVPDSSGVRQPVLSFISTPVPHTDVIPREVVTPGPSPAGGPEATLTPSVNLTTWPSIIPEPSRAPLPSDTPMPTPEPENTPAPEPEP